MHAIERLRRDLKQNEAILLTSDINRRYFSGFNSSAGAVLITKDHAFLFLDFRYREMGERAQKNGVIPAFFTLKDAATTANVRKLCKEQHIQKLFFEDRRMTCFDLLRFEEALPDMEFDALGDKAETVRAQKTEPELIKIRAAQALTEAAYDHVLSCIVPSATDTELACEIDCFLRKNGAENAFETILISGKNTSLPHGKPTGEKLVKNAFITMDFGAKLDGYCSDMTRTVVLGHADEEMRRVYQTVLEAQKAAFSVIHAGVIGENVDAAARSHIYNAGYEGCFGHSTGHSLGLEIHEDPCFRAGESSPIPKGAVLSVEPGIYLPGKFGVRIEDIVSVTENGYENLTQAKKELLEL